jgi:hypothetical protein
MRLALLGLALLASCVIIQSVGMVALPETALYFSLASYTTIGFGDVVIGPG